MDSGPEAGSVWAHRGDVFCGLSYLEHKGSIPRRLLQFLRSCTVKVKESITELWAVYVRILFKLSPSFLGEMLRIVAENLMASLDVQRLTYEA